MTSPAPPRPDLPLALVLSGGNALGAYQAGAYQALHEAGWLPDWVAGASVGALNGALICGNPPERRLERLEALWRPAPGALADLWPSAMEEARRTAAANATLSMGQPGLFTPRALYGPWWNPLGNSEPSSLYDNLQMRDRIEQLLDLDLLNRGTPRFSATAVDVESGEDVVFDSTMEQIGADHIRASSALMPAFPPVELGDRLLADAGLSANLPLDMVLGERASGPLLCIAVDLLPLHAPRPSTLGDALARTQDLLFAAQSRRAIAAWQAIFDARTAAGDDRSVTLLTITYSNQQQEVSGKAFDFSPASVRRRWDIGYTDMNAAMAGIDLKQILRAEPGLRVVGATGRGGSRGFEPVRIGLEPSPI